MIIAIITFVNFVRKEFKSLNKNVKNTNGRFSGYFGVSLRLTDRHSEIFLVASGVERVV